MLAKTGGRVIVPRRDRVHERAGALGAPLQSIQVIMAEHVFDGRGPEGDVLRMVPAGHAAGLAVVIDRDDLREVRDRAAQVGSFQHPRIDFHSSFASGSDDFRENITIGIVECLINRLIAERSVFEEFVVMLDPHERQSPAAIIAWCDTVIVGQRRNGFAKVAIVCVGIEEQRISGCGSGPLWLQGYGR